jgi:pimeloyl-ACP methyl ester carboxylesterase
MTRTIFRLSIVVLAIAGAAVTPAWAQDKATVFVHGFISDGGTWRDAAARLQTRLAITPQTPTINWRDDFPTQASSLESQLSSLPASPVAVGHSNGGLASRQWSRQHPLGGLVTLGTPNQGAPFVSNLLRWAAFNDNLYYALSNLYNAFTYSVVDWTDVLAVITNALQFIT